MGGHNIHNQGQYKSNRIANRNGKQETENLYSVENPAAKIRAVRMKSHGIAIVCIRGLHPPNFQKASSNMVL